MRRRYQFLAMVLALLLIPVVAIVSAQDGPLYPTQLALQIDASPTGPPLIESLTDGEVIFHIDVAGTAAGDLAGSFVQDITQVDPCPTCYAPDQLQPITAFFTIETDEGKIEGYYVGSFYATEGTFPDYIIQVHGQILSVSAVYADLYLADVYYNANVDFEEVEGETVPLGDSGTMIIAPR